MRFRPPSGESPRLRDEFQGVRQASPSHRASIAATVPQSAHDHLRAAGCTRAVALRSQGTGSRAVAAGRWCGARASLPAAPAIAPGHIGSRGRLWGSRQSLMAQAIRGPPTGRQIDRGAQPRRPKPSGAGNLFKSNEERTGGIAKPAARSARAVERVSRAWNGARSRTGKVRGALALLGHGRRPDARAANRPSRERKAALAPTAG